MSTNPFNPDTHADRRDADQRREPRYASRVMTTNAVVTGVVTAVLCGLVLFAMTLILVIRDGDDAGPHLGLLRYYYPGYSVTVVGAFVGLAYAAASGFVLGFIGAWVYNRVAARTAARRDRA